MIDIESAQFWNRFDIGGQREKRAIKAAVNGDRAAFDTLARSYIPSLRGFLNRRVGPDGVDDVLQETLVAAWSSVSRYKSAWRFKAWLYGIASHKCIDYYRVREARSVETADEGLNEAVVESFENRLNTRDRIKQALEKLPDAQRDVLELYYYGEFTLNEIAEATGRNLNTVKYHFYRGHDALGRDLSQDELEAAATHIRSTGRR